MKVIGVLTSWNIGGLRESLHLYIGVLLQEDVLDTFFLPYSYGDDVLNNVNGYVEFYTLNKS